jgi:hypothetical protein
MAVPAALSFLNQMDNSYSATRVVAVRQQRRLRATYRFVLAGILLSQCDDSSGLRVLNGAARVRSNARTSSGAIASASTRI